MSSEHTVLVVTQDNDPQLSMLKDLRHIVGRKPEDFAAAVNDPVVILAWSAPRAVLRDVFHMCKDVRWVHSRSAGLDNVLFPELVASDVPLTNGSGVFSQSLGEFALAAILYFAKDFRRMIRSQMAGEWDQFDVEEIDGQTVGIVGYGDIGRAVAKRVRPMGMTVLAVKRHAPEGADPLIDQFYKPEDLLAMLARCDYIVVSLPLTQETRHMISDKEFAAMKPTAVVINVGRGPVIDQAAIVRVLTAKRIKGAGLDVFEREPLPPGDPMYRLENVLLSPHCADHTKDWLNQAIRFFLEQYHRFSNGEPLENVVDKNLGY
ncbi:MAG TPA: D-2-hydroxyacid dehydrogenase [Acidobacteriaceae bacterium]|jgi:phosphoglycerate dehydrogenase-like enzyme|nr:D-2-hydroxyacid dehydrogenase [Acidobacteriaceae bacterium]